MEFSMEVKRGVMRYLDDVADHLDAATPEEKEAILQRLYAHIYEALVRANAHTLPGLQQVLATLPPPASYTLHPKSETPVIELPATAARWCPEAIIGASLLPLGLYGLFRGCQLAVSASASSAPLSAGHWLIMLLGLLFPFIIMLLGITGIEKIRLSRGRLYGLALAVSTALVFPILLVDAVVYFLLHAWFTSLWNAVEVFPVAVFLIIMLVDYLIIQHVWQQAAGPIRHGNWPAANWS